MNFDYQTLLFNFIVTLFIYMIVPIIIAFACPHSQKQSKIIAIVNSVIIYIGFTILYSVLGIDRVANAATSCMFAFINYYILKKSSTLDNYKAKSSEIIIQKSDLILITCSILILIVVVTYILINLINNYKVQLIEKDEIIKELKEELSLNDYEKYIDSILKNSY